MTTDEWMILGVGFFVYIGILYHIERNFRDLNKRIDDIVKKNYDF